MIKKIDLSILLTILFFSRISSTNFFSSPEKKSPEKKVEEVKKVENIKDKKIEKINNIKDFNSQVLSQEFALVKFGAPWCSPCQRLKSVLEKINESYPQLKIFDIDIDESQELASKYKIRNIPVLIFFNNGKEISKKTGLFSEKELKAEIKKDLNL